MPIIAPIWDDVLTGTCGYTVSATNLIIRWNLRVPKNSAANGYFVGVDLASNGTITFLYPAVTTYKPDGLNLQSASIGFADGCGEFYSVNVLSSISQSVSDLTETATNSSQYKQQFHKQQPGNTVNVGSTAGITVGMFVGGTNIPGGATVTAVGATSVTISAPTTILATSTRTSSFTRMGINYIFTPAPPANDVVQAISLGINGTCSYSTRSNVNATTSGVAMACAVAPTDTKDVGSLL